MSEGPVSPRRDGAWVVAFVVVCLVLVGVRILTSRGGSGHDTAATPSPTDPSSSSSLAPGPLGQWKAVPDAPEVFEDPHLVTPSEDVVEMLERSTRLTEWPDVTNGARLDGDSFDGCDVVDDITPLCVLTPDEIDPRKVAVLLGDTTMGEAYWYMLRDTLGSRGWTLVSFTLSGCPAAVVTPVRPVVADRDPADCARHQDAYARLVAHWKPSLVVMADSEDEPYSLLAGDTATEQETRAALGAYRGGLARAVRTVSAPGRRVLLLSPAPAQQSASTCSAQGWTPDRCQQAPYATWFALNGIQRKVAARTGATYADLLSFFCYQMICPSAVTKDSGDLVVRSDESHVTPEYALFLRASFARYLRTQGIIGS
ncbi:MAG: SGNH hydrolase domain-containing protein [Nocardioides sp.]|uniref:SGNH hydrolase domain-containing protein n=1 Tax=Nocardioides sp. TaxID=35761 RepID=UPI0039E6C9BA